MRFMWARSLAWIGRRTSNPKTPGSNPGGSAHILKLLFLIILIKKLIILWACSLVWKGVRLLILRSRVQIPPSPLKNYPK